MQGCEDAYKFVTSIFRALFSSLANSGSSSKSMLDISSKSIVTQSSCRGEGPECCAEKCDLKEGQEKLKSEKTENPKLTSLGIFCENHGSSKIQIIGQFEGLGSGGVLWCWLG